MSQTPLIIAAETPDARRPTLAALIETTKPGITRLVTITALVGFALSALMRGDWDIPTLVVAAVGTLVGTAMTAGGANALNQWFEVPRDACMDRTRGRPIPGGRLPSTTVVWFGTCIAVLGLIVLSIMAGVVPAIVSLACIVSYVFVYTPLKPHTAWSTLVGAIPGALPPLIGWTAAAKPFGVDALTEPGGLTLAAIMLVWQLPHFMAIAWIYREDYAKGGLRMLPVLDPSGVRTAGVMLGTGVLLVACTLAPVWAMAGRVGFVYGAFAGLSGLVFLGLCVRFTLERTPGAARAVFIASVIHLPVLLMVMVGEAAVRVGLSFML
ncbi:MAG: heme o synthase [Phycisphaerales bacterium]